MLLNIFVETVTFFFRKFDEYLFEIENLYNIINVLTVFYQFNVE